MPDVAEPPAEAFDLAGLRRAQATADAKRGELYLEFLRRDSLSCGLYALEAGAEDPQQPNREDEVYLVLDGRASLEVAGQDHPVGPGSILFVAREVPHRFHDIRERLEVLVFFAPAETG
jgi:mannose-6-phosphate isomerase-like protein (cupin superfamily)